MTDHTLLLINIPNPRYTEYDRIRHPHTLQIIDEALHPEYLVNQLSDCGLMLHSLETHSIWVEDDYQFLIVKKRQPFREVKLSGSRNFGQKAFNRLRREWNRRYYKYP
jgi:hypothetical protein